MEPSAKELYRIWKPEDYPMLKSWWEAHGWPSVPETRLPPLGIIYDDTAAGWLYMDNGGSGVAMIEWLVTNPGARPLAAAKAITNVVTALKAEAARMDYAIALTTCRQPALARLLERSGFIVTDKEMIHLVSPLK
jgi:hypothetical protein